MGLEIDKIEFTDKDFERLPDGGWPAEKKYYRTGAGLENGNDYVDWGPTGKKQANPWVTVDALSVLQAAGYRVV